MDFTYSKEYAQGLDRQDPLASFRDKFHFPSYTADPVIYFTGNSLGLQPKSVADYIKVELEDWSKWGVEGHFHAKNPWFSYHEILTESTAKIVGALPSEVVVMNGLTVNLHLLLVSFYRPKGKRTKIICEQKAFPSDQYALESQVKFHGLNPANEIIEIAPREGEHNVHPDDVYQAISDCGDELALIMIGGVNYYSGQVFPMKEIASAGHAVGAMVGFDLAHGAGNIELKLHDWKVDFACWCSYKYLNSGPGNVSGAFVHEKYAYDPSLPRFAGWWGYNKDSRFLMNPGFDPMPGAEGWQLSNAPVLGMAAHKASLDIFEEAGMPALIEKSELLFAYLNFVIQEVDKKSDHIRLEVITPQDKGQHGCQVSIVAQGAGKSLFDRLTEESVVADWREPNVIRIAPVPLYNSFDDIYRFGKALEKAIT